MLVKNKTYQPLQALTVQSKEDLPGFRFVSHLGSLCADGARALGVTETDWLNGEYAAVIALGTMAVETSTTVLAGADVTSAANGKARTATTGEPVNGRALDTCQGSGYVRIKIVP